jgi:hypothetical protein
MISVQIRSLIVGIEVYGKIQLLKEMYWGTNKINIQRATLP